MVYNLFTYRRPARVSSSRISIISENAESVSSGQSTAYGIPEALSFEKIINGGTCPPCTLRDFMEYVFHIEHNAENLQFFLWFRDYVKRFDALPEKDRVLSPEWTMDVAEAQALASQTNAVSKKVNPEIAAMLKGTDFAPKSKVAGTEVNGNPFNTPPRTPAGEKERDGMIVPAPEAAWSDDQSTLKSTIGGNKNLNAVAAGAFNNAEHLQPFTIQPFREEISRIIGLYIAEDGARQLNLSAKERTALLHALANTTHPSAFKNVIGTVEWTLRHQAHPMFVRYSICNGNRPRVLFARGLGIGGIIVGIIFAIIITLSDAGRGWRALAGIGFFIGISTLFAAWKGMCVVLHGMHHRHVRPWELFQDAETYKDEYDMSKGSFDSFGSGNSYEDEPWVAKYEKRNIVRKVFDREVWIQEPALRQIQDTIFLQAILVSVGLSAVAVGIFCAVPKGNYYSF